MLVILLEGQAVRTDGRASRRASSGGAAEPKCMQLISGQLGIELMMPHKGCIDVLMMMPHKGCIRGA
jgi:hypothetical protein